MSGDRKALLAAATAGKPGAVRVVVLRGAGDHFSAGADITELLADRATGSPSFMDANMAAEHALAMLPKPTIAVVQGDCIGGGCAVAIDCDFRLAVAGARFGITPAKLGIVYPPASLTQAATKEMIAAVTEHGVVSADLAETWAREVAMSGEMTEGVAAFQERRAPRFPWKGRR